MLINSNFVSTRTTVDLQLPQSLKTPSQDDLKTIHSKIEEVLNSGNLLDLQEVLPLVYEG